MHDDLCYSVNINNYNYLGYKDDSFSSGEILSSFYVGKNSVYLLKCDLGMIYSLKFV